MMCASGVVGMDILVETVEWVDTGVTAGGDRHDDLVTAGRALAAGVDQVHLSFRLAIHC